MEFRELDERVRSVFELYNRTAFISFTLRESDENFRFYQCVNYVMSCLCEEYQFILEREYVDRAPHNWWMLYYSRTTYYRLKKRAMTEFVRRLKWQGINDKITLTDNI